MTTYKTKAFSVKSTLFILFVVFCIQFTELKIDVIKLSELLLLLITPFLYFKNKINKWSLYLLILFTLWLVISLAINPFRDFYLLTNVSVLKKPYLISIGRYLELISCINLATLVYLFLKNKTKQQVQIFIKYIFNFCLFFTIINTLIFALLKFNFILESNLLYYDHGIRLKGWYVEGGPYGLMVSFTFILTFFYKSKYHLLNRFFLIFVIFFLARSKAGIVLILTWYVLMYYKIAYNKLRELNFIIIIIGGFLISLVIIKLGDGYIKDIVNVKREMKERPQDVNLVMGRIAGLFIFPNMVSHNPILGIGLGNYPIIRNNPEFLKFIPKSPPGKTDAHGFGGLIQLLVDGGLVFLILFLLIVYKLYQKLKKKENGDEKYLQIFLFFFVFGVQIYFLYPWVLIGISIYYSQNHNNEKNNCN
ncbi:hypothetical protein [Polaribacter sp.]|uniref:hypothetical protein n=1 Tax=Polaribacter sp. TaxID=1920175 RepID=UPI003EF2C251